MSNGPVQEAILFNRSTSFFQSQCFPTTRTTIYFTVSLWVYLTSSTTGGILVHLSNFQDGSGIRCLDLLALTSNGSIVAQVMVNSSIVIDLQDSVLPLNSWIHLAVRQRGSGGVQSSVDQHPCSHVHTVVRHTGESQSSESILSNELHGWKFHGFCLGSFCWWDR